MAEYKNGDIVGGIAVGTIRGGKEWRGSGWQPAKSDDAGSSIAGGVKVAPEKPEDLDDKPGDSPLIAASKRRKRAERDREKAAKGGSAGEQAGAVAKMTRDNK